jgi:hypothetical protein
MKYIKKLSIGLVIAVLSSGIFVGLVPSKAYAAPGDPIAIKDQYVIYKSADLLKKCIFIANEYKSTNAQDVINSIFKTDGGADAGIGKLYGKFLGNTDIGSFECNTPKTINAALSRLGYDDIYNFAAEMGFPNDKLTKRDLDTKIDKRVQDKGVPNDLYGTRRFRYWYYNTVFRASLADGGCKGTLADEPSATAKTNIGPSSFWNVGTDGVVKEYKYARYDVETGNNLPDLDDEVLKNTGLGTNEITCIKIAREITKERADAYAAFLTTPEGGAEKPANTAGTSGTGSDSTGSGGDGDDNLSVQCSFNAFNPASYFICPLIAGFITAMNELDQAITDQLNVNTAALIQGDEADDFKQVWNNMRNLAISFIVIVGLLMVIGTAVEVGPFDPYTVKKVMPRLLVAVIVISLSWPLVIFLIDASNSLGLTIKGLIQQPFEDILNKPLQFSGGQQWAAAAGIAGAGVALGIVGLLSFVATAFLGVALAFLVLVLRQILVILLAIIAPIAIAMYILPNTQKAGKAWWDLFARALLVFPIIAAFIATGRVFAAITVANSGGSPGTIEGFIAFFAYYGPYFALPFAFRLAGGAVAQIGGFVNDRGRGGFDRLKKFRQGQTQKNIEGIKSDNRFKGTNRLSRGASNALFMGSQASSVGVAGLVNPKLGRDRMRASTSEKRMELYNKARENANVRGILANDDFAQAAVSGDGSEAAIKKHLVGERGYSDVDANQAAQQIMRARREVGVEAFNDSALVATAGSGTGFKGGSGEMLSQIGLMSKGDSQRESFLYNESRKAAEAAGRTDLMGYSFGEGIDAIQQLKKPGADVQTVTEKLNDKVIESKGAGALATSKSQSVKNLSGAVQRRLDKARNEMIAAPGDADKEAEYKRALASTANMLDVSSSASPENAAVLAGILQQDSGAVKKNNQGQVIKRLTLGEHIEDMRSDPTFATYRREYGSAQAQAQAKSGSQTPQTPTTPVI